MIVYFKPRAPFAKSAPRSDTLFGAIAWAVRVLYGEAELIKVLGEFDRGSAAQAAPPFVLSSLFPYFDDGAGKILFLPRPLRPPDFDWKLKDQHAYQTLKRMRKTSLVSLDIFKAIADGSLGESSLLMELLKGEASAYRMYAGALMKQEEYQRVRVFPSLTVNGEPARNSINRLSVATDGAGGQLFYQPIVSSRVYQPTASPRALPQPEAHTGFYLLIKVNGERAAEVSAILQTALHFLAEKGIGGDTSVGYGHGEVEPSDEELLSDHTDGTRLVTLSLLHPSAADREHLARQQAATFARLERRKGFIESAYAEETQRVWKPTLIMLSEGATFPRDGERQVYGTLFRDESPREGLSFKLRINGLAYTVPMKEDAAL